MTSERRAQPGKFLVVGWHTDGSGKELLWNHRDRLECALRYAEQLRQDARERAAHADYGVYDEHGNRLDTPNASEGARS